MCRVVTRKVIEAAIESGARTVDEVVRRSGAGTDCGKCRRTIIRLLETEPPRVVDARDGSFAGSG